MNERKTYYSFHDVPLEASNFYDSSIQPSGIKFTRQEITHIIIAMAVLTVAFSFVFVDYPPLANLDQVIEFLPISFLAIVTAFFCHEIAHKYVGQKFGYWSEFRIYPQGLLFALILGIVAGIVFAAPGAVQIFGRPNKEEMGKISIVGPLTNMILGLLFIGIWYYSTGIIKSISFFISYINIFLSLFNLIPFGPLDGAKIMRWRIEYWGVLIGIDIVVLIFIFRLLG
jgi:Zn-dependent protease